MNRKINWSEYALEGKHISNLKKNSSSNKRHCSSPSMMPSIPMNNNGTMAFSVTDILQPFDVDTSNSYKRSLEMAHALATSSASSAAAAAAAAAYHLPRPSASITPASLCNSSFQSTSGHNNYYNSNVSSSSTFSPNNHQYYDYSGALPSNGTNNPISGQYSPSSCWYGSTASKSFIDSSIESQFDGHIDFSVTIFSWFINSNGQCRISSKCLRTSSRSNDEIGLCSISVCLTKT